MSSKRHQREQEAASHQVANKLRVHDPRFDQLLARAMGGDENALGDLFLEFGCDMTGGSHESR